MTPQEIKDQKKLSTIIGKIEALQISKLRKTQKEADALRNAKKLLIDILR